MAEKKKTECPVSRPEFLNHAKAIPLQIGDVPAMALTKEFSTGSLGWYCNMRIPVIVNGKACQVQVNMNLTIIGSKEAKASSGMEETLKALADALPPGPHPAEVERGYATGPEGWESASLPTA